MTAPTITRTAVADAGRPRPLTPEATAAFMSIVDTLRAERAARLSR